MSKLFPFHRLCRWPRCWTCWRTSWTTKGINMRESMEASLERWDKRPSTDLTVRRCHLIKSAKRSAGVGLYYCFSFPSVQAPLSSKKALSCSTVIGHHCLLLLFMKLKVLTGHMSNTTTPAWSTLIYTDQVLNDLLTLGGRSIYAPSKILDRVAIRSRHNSVELTDKLLAEML